MADVIAPEPVQEAVRNMIKSKGESETAQFLGLSRDTLARIAGGLTVRSVSLELVRTKLKNK